MTAFHPGGHRQTHVGGTDGAVFGDGEKLVHHDFRTDRREVIDTAAGDATILGGHGGGDYGLMTAFIAAVAEGDFAFEAGRTLYLHRLAGMKAARVVVAAAGDGSPAAWYAAAWAAWRSARSLFPALALGPVRDGKITAAAARPPSESGRTSWAW
jgi:hypothetical protein